MSLMMESGALPLSFFTHGIWGTAVSRGILVGDIQRLQVPILYECMHLQKKINQKTLKKCFLFYFASASGSTACPSWPCRHPFSKDFQHKSSSNSWLMPPRSFIIRWNGSRQPHQRVDPSIPCPSRVPTRGLRLHGSHRRLHGPCRAEDARASPRSSDAPAQLTMHTLHAVAEVSLTDGRIKARA
jgi:hypothetical protein